MIVAIYEVSTHMRHVIDIYKSVLKYVLNFTTIEIFESDFYDTKDQIFHLKPLPDNFCVMHMYPQDTWQREI